MTMPTTTVLGTSAYMAPEAFRGDVSVKLDTFSFGVVSWLLFKNGCWKWES
jgi:serine/threonine protein kinase